MVSTPSQDNRQPSKFPLSRQTIFKSLRLGLLTMVLAFVSWLLWQRSQSFTSRQGVVNAAVVAVRSPLEGKLTLNPLELGAVLTAGTTVGNVENPLHPQIVTNQQMIISQLKTLQSQLKSIDSRIQSRQVLLAQFQLEQGQQDNLQQDFQAEKVTQREKELQASQSAARAANLEAERYRFLSENGAISQSLATQAQAAAEQADALVERQAAALKQMRTEQRAITKGLQLEGSRVLSYPDIRVRELEQEIRDLQQQKDELVVALKAKQTELNKINEQLNLAQSTPIKIPITGVLWSLERKNTEVPEYINLGDLVLEMLDCDNVWVDAFVTEQRLDDLRMGAEVEVRFLSDPDNKQYTGEIISIRSGIGRITPGDDVALPPEDVVRRELAVKIRVKDVQLPDSEFCGVGRSVEVRFPRLNS